MVVLSVCEVCYVYEGYVVVQWYCIFEGLVEMCLITNMMGVVCEVVAVFLKEVVFTGCW